MKNPNENAPTERSEEALSKGNAAPSPWPPRVWIEKYEPIKVGLPVAYQYWPALDRQTKYTDGVEYLSLEEHTHLLAEAVRIAKAQVYSEVALMADNLSHDDYINGRLIDQLNRKASELRKEKGATLTPENGGSDG